MRKLFDIPWVVAKFIIGVIVILVVAYGAATIYTNVKHPNSPPETPDARYRIIVVNTGLELYTDSYQRQGDIYALSGVYQLKGNKYRYHNEPLLLGPEFGRIEVEELK